MTNRYEFDEKLGCYRIYFSDNSSFLIDREDFDTINKFTWFKGRRGYPIAHLKLEGKKLTRPVHKVILSDVGKDMNIDHINRDRMDNRRSNLRVCSHQENMFNQRKRNTNTSGYIGVAYHKAANKYESYINLDAKKHYLGLYDTAIEAARVRDEYAKRMYGEYAKLNFESEGCA